LSNWSTSQNTINLAGWLFADLLLGLSMIFLLSSPPPPPTPPPLTPTLTSTPTATSTSTPTSTPTPKIDRSLSQIETASITPVPTGLAPVGLSKPQCYNLELKGTDPSDGSEKDAILKQLNRMLPNNPSYRAGLLLIWGHGKSIYDGRRIAMRVGDVIQEAYPLSFAKVSRKSLGYDFGDYKHVQVEVYFYTDSEWTGGQPVPCEFTD
jgi:hypothetical protein